QANLVGELELPMCLGIVGGASRVHPMAKAAYDIVQVESAKELAQVITTVGLAQNIGTLTALATAGIQIVHMALHARYVAVAVGATKDQVEQTAQKLVEAKQIRVGYAKKLMEENGK